MLEKYIFLAIYTLYQFYFYLLSITKFLYAYIFYIVIVKPKN